MSALQTKLDSLIAQTDLDVSEKQREQLVGYVELLDKWNKAYNLTSVRDPLEMLVKHILDSIVVGTHLQGERFIDVALDQDCQVFLWRSCIRRKRSFCSIASVSASVLSSKLSTR